MIQNGWEAKKAHGTFLEYRQHSREQTNIRLATHSELIFYKEKYRELLDEKQRLSRLLIYKALIPLMFCEKCYYIIKKDGFKEFIKRGLAFLRTRFFG